MGLKTISEQYRQSVLALNLKTPNDIIQGLTDLSGTSNLQSYLDAVGKDAVIHSSMVKNPGDITSNAAKPRQLDLGRNDTTFAPNGYEGYKSDLGTEVVISDYNVTNPGNITDAAMLPRSSDLNRNLPEITPEGYNSQRVDLGTEVTINDYNVKNPGNITTQAIDPRNRDLTKNLPEITPDGYNSYRADLGTDTSISDYSVTNPGNITSESEDPRNKDLTKNLPNITPFGYGAYRSDLGQEATISDYNVKDPGNIDKASVDPRRRDLGRNDKKITPEGYRSQRSDLGTESVINDYKVNNPDTINNTSDKPRNFDFSRNNPNIAPDGYKSFANDKGTQTTLSDYKVVDDGAYLDNTAAKELKKLMVKNKPINQSDPSENDPLYSAEFSYTYSSLLNSIGKVTTINDYNIPNALSVSLLSNQTPEVALNLILQQNRYVPVETNTYDATVKSLLNNQNIQPYIQAYKSGVYTFDQPSTYEPSQFLNISAAASPVSVLTNVDPMESLLNGTIAQPLKDETLLMNIAALQLKFNFEARLLQNIAQETVLRTKLDESLTNPNTLFDLLSNPKSWFEKDNTISVSSNPVGKAVQFAEHLAGVNLPFSYINYNTKDYIPQCFNNEFYNTNKKMPKTALGKFISDLSGRTARNERDMYFLNHTGDGQKAALFANISVNKYSPNYTNDYESGLFQAGESVAQIIRGVTAFLGLGSGKRPVGDYYVGSKKDKVDPFYLMQDSDGDIVNTNDKVTEALITKTEYGDTTREISKIEPGYNQVSEYGSIETNFVWSKNAATEKVFVLKGETGSTLTPSNRIKNTDSLSNNINFIECSILDKTQRLLDKPINNQYNSPIDQTLTKFYDGYSFTSRANATIRPVVIPKKNSNGDTIGNRYIVPGLDERGKRDDRKMYEQAELCRVWTKGRPYSNVTGAIRYKELIRRERNSILDRFGNLNIFPSQLNVNGGSAKKYMFSIENLAWRDTQHQKELKTCEKGPNGGRIMWFPPYDIRFTDDTSSHWTTHQFLGRPEPIYTYNNTERSGTISFKIVVDHPSILNLLVKKELAKLTDGEVDEILNAFWSGCQEFDIFELAKIWNQFSQSDIEYFKAVLNGVNKSKPNEFLTPQFIKALVDKSVDEPKFNNTNDIIPSSFTKGLFFENDVPLDPAKYATKTGVYGGNIDSFGVYFKQYKNLNLSDISTNVQVLKKTIDTKAVNPDWLRYYYTLGTKSADNYFMATDRTEVFFGFDKQQADVISQLKDPKYNNFNLSIKLTAYASSLGSNVPPPEYNKNLGLRRAKSVIKWLLTDNVMVTTNKIFNKEQAGDEITKDNIDSILDEVTTTLTVWREAPVNPAQPNNTRDKITFSIDPASVISFTDAASKINPTATNIKTREGDVYFMVRNAPTEDKTAQKDCYCFESTDKKNIYIADPTKIDGTGTIDKSQIGTFNPAGNTAYTYADTVCSALSIESAYSRRVDMAVTALKKPVTPNKPEVVKEPQFATVDTLKPLDNSNITKRDIAQRILDRLITECDYFEVLKQDAPTVYKSMKEKLKYFIPGMHSMTPEGLNSRLTFLQQCMRPGDTIKRSENDTCDASNTAFGKPPICVLRLGDMYNTKMLITNLNISYEPLIWDLNPEGIGVQPMIANVSMSIKYIGGSGLRTYVEELQNALSFNYYANADIYDGRTYANTNDSERALINQERNFFDGNQLDLIPIIAAGEKYVQDKINETLPGGTIGVVTLVNQPTAPGGLYSDFINNAKIYDTGTVYQVYDVVYFDNGFYLRKADNNATYGISGNTLSNKIPTDTTYWMPIEWRNYGEQGFLFEYIGSAEVTNVAPPTNNDGDEYLSKRYFKTYEVEYYDTFKDLYNTYAKLVVDNFTYNKLSSKTSILRLLLLNKNYNRYVTGQKVSVTDQETGIITTSTTNPIDDFNTLKVQSTGITKTVSGLTSGATDSKFYLYNAFDIEAESRNYKEYGKVGDIMSHTFGVKFEPQPMKLHLYPQEYLYKIGNGIDIVRGFYNDNTRYNPGNLTNSNTQTNEVGGIYIKDYSYYRDNIDGLFFALKEEMKAKLKLELSHFWFKTPESLNTYKNYLSYFESPHRKIFTDYLVNMLDNYYADLTETMSTTITDLTDNTGKFATLLSGLSVIAEGYDVRLDDKNEKRYYEVIPNGKKLATKANTIFGYEPYNEYKTSSLNNHEIINFTSCADYTFLATSPMVSDENKIKFLSMGNGNYFFKQISGNQYIQEVAKTGYTFNNVMVQSSALNDEVPVTGTDPNFVMYSGVSGYSGVTINTIQDYSAQLTSGGTTVQTLTAAGGTYNKFYGMKYTFEKINYELFDFSNKTIDIMLNDNFIYSDFDLDIIINPTNNFLTQVTGLTSDATNLFYYSDRVDYKSTPINYYTYEVPTGSSISDKVSTINNFLIYTLPITTELATLGPTPESSLVGQNIYMSGLLDLIFLDFFMSISDADKEKIMTEIKKPENKPVKGISTDPKTSAKQLTDRYNKISNVLDGLFTSITNYRNSASDKLTDLAKTYTDNYDIVKTNVNNVFTTNSSWKDITADLIVPSLIKGSEEDYKLSMRDTQNIKESAKNSYSLFINNRNRFNIINTNENKQTIIGPIPDTGSTQTELSKYEIGQ